MASFLLDFKLYPYIVLNPIFIAKSYPTHSKNPNPTLGKIQIYIVCPRSLDPTYIVSDYMK